MKPKKRRTPKGGLKEYTYVGIDGEGQGRTRHDYIYMGAARLDGKKSWSVESASWRKSWCEERRETVGHVTQIPTRAALDFMLALPVKNPRFFSYGFNYDLTKILEQLPDQKLWLLFRPEKRVRSRNFPGGPVPVRWGGYSLNLQGTKFTLKREGEIKDGKRTSKKGFLLWDILKFYQSKFVGALTDWNVGTEEMRARMSVMKDKRGEFDKESPDDVANYCLEECRCMAELAKKLVDAHDAAGLTLTKFYGAGSSGAAMLALMEIDKKIIAPSDEMKDAVACGYFGGRFEDSVRGPVNGPLYAYDISSAYPYQMMSLPCLIHGTWSHTTNRLELDENPRPHKALVRYRLSPERVGDSCDHWAPFPFREVSGTSCYPSVSGGGWIYSDEYLAGERLWPHVEFEEAWILDSSCSCKPFEAIGGYYLHRIALGKESAGKCLKLAVNSVYGKLAQSVGHAPFNSWIWAGMITSGCRAQILDLMGRAKRMSDILMVATDGVVFRERITPPEPRTTGTDRLLNGHVNPKPLGGWEEKIYPEGIFFARPGIYFPKNPTEADLKEVKARGVGKYTVLQQYSKIIESFETFGIERSVKVDNVSRFCGAKTSISQSGKPGAFEYMRADGTNGPNAPRYGNWIRREIEMSFNPLPKRARMRADRSLEVRRIELHRVSAPYDRAVLSPEALELMAAEEELREQPDLDFCEED